MEDLHNHEAGRPVADYERIRRRAAAERRHAIDELMRTVFNWRGRRGAGR